MLIDRACHGAYAKRSCGSFKPLSSASTFASVYWIMRASSMNNFIFLPCAPNFRERIWSCSGSLKFDP
jgi:hypothetical protein